MALNLAMVCILINFPPLQIKLEKNKEMLKSREKLIKGHKRHSSVENLQDIQSPGGNAESKASPYKKTVTYSNSGKFRISNQDDDNDYDDDDKNGDEIEELFTENSGEEIKPPIINSDPHRVVGKFYQLKKIKSGEVKNIIRDRDNEFMISPSEMFKILIKITNEKTKAGVYVGISIVSFALINLLSLGRIYK